MKIKTAVFDRSAPDLKSCPVSSLPEFAFIGRSNVGKSSLINLLAERKDLAKTSATPGKTRLINFFRMNNTWSLVDLPGYGYAKLGQQQRADFNEIFTVMTGLPVTIRLLDPPLHEFLPHGDAEFAELSDTIGIGVDTLKRRADELHEMNPMLGHRGCRLGITFPEIYEMQARAIFEAACDVAAASGDAPVPEVMIPLVATKRELAILKKLVDDTAATLEVLKRRFPAILAPGPNDICYATTNRQGAVKAIASSVDLMLVIGGANSSNSLRLVEVAEREGTTAYLISRADELQWEWLAGVGTVGVSAGASAPELLVRELVAKLSQRFDVIEREVETVEENVTFKLPRGLEAA